MHSISLGIVASFTQSEACRHDIMPHVCREMRGRVAVVAHQQALASSLPHNLWSSRWAGGDAVRSLSIFTMSLYNAALLIFMLLLVTSIETASD
jgi:hypothetical protein